MRPKIEVFRCRNASKKGLDGYLFLRKSRRLRERGKSDLQHQMTDHVPERAALFSKTQALPQARALSEDEIAAEIAAYRGGQ